MVKRSYRAAEGYFSEVQRDGELIQSEGKVARYCADTIQRKDERGEETWGTEGRRVGDEFDFVATPVCSSFGESRAGEAAARCMQPSRVSRHAYHPKLKMT
jgi:hypothetical protein